MGQAIQFSSCHCIVALSSQTVSFTFNWMEILFFSTPLALLSFLNGGYTGKFGALKVHNQFYCNFSFYFLSLTSIARL